jgi:S1-C subfamily serine protease
MLRSVLALGGVLWAGTALAAGPFGTIHVGLWTGGAYTDDTTGAFSHCAAENGYGNGVGVAFGQSADRAWLLSFAYPGWRMNVGESVPMQVIFDGQAQFQLFAIAVTRTQATAVLPNNAALEQFRKSHLMVAILKGQTYQFNMNSTGQVVPVVANCVAKVKASGLANAGDFSILPPKPPAPATPAKSETTASVASAPSQKAAASVPSSRPPRLVDVNATGFVVSATGHILTNNHVVEGCVGDVHGNLSGESPMTLRVVSKDETNDLALLQASKAFKEVAIIRSTAVHSGDSIVAIGYPYHGLLTSDFTVSTGIVSSLSGLLNDTRFLQISAPIQPGNSGGPLLDTSGNVVGVVAAKINAIKFAKATGDFPENINFAIKMGAVRDFLDNSVVPYQTAEPSAELKTAQIASNARAYTMLVSCSAKEEASTDK